jgi:hypothetical protein
MVKITAVMVVRNEADLLGVNLQYHAAQGISEFRILDNGSSDRTPQLIREMARRLSVLWTRDEGPFHQSEMMTGLAREAHRAGADWIVPVDADEFWNAGSRPLVRMLEQSAAGAIVAEVRNFIQERDTSSEGSAALLTMTHRTGKARGNTEQSWGLVESGQIAFVEIECPRKWLLRSSEALTIGAGAHDAGGVAGPVIPSSQVVCLHAPIRSRRALDAKAEHGQRLLEAGYPPYHGWQNQRWHRLQTEGRLDEEWRANSVCDGHLGERRTPVVFDPLLRDAVREMIADGTHAAARR